MPTYNGTTANDNLRGSSGDDNMAGNGGDDSLDGSGGNDFLLGGVGDDVLFGGSGLDVLIGGDGDDLLWGGGFGNTGIAVPDQTRDDLDGGAGNDSILIGNLDTALGGAGDDVFEAEEQGNTSYRATMDGGTGDDVANFSFVRYRPTIYLDPAATAADGFTLRSIELVLLGDFGSRVIGGSGDDSVLGGAGVDEIDGGSGADLLTGEAGNDILRGGEGDDLLIGGVGSDTLDGGGGADVFAYLATNESPSNGSTGPDVIQNFQTGLDKIDLTALLPTSITISTDGAYTLVSAQTPTGAFAVRVLGAVLLGDVIPSISVPGEQFNGGAGSDILTGTNGNDVIVGGGGSDTLTGGAGADTFRYLAASDSTAAAQDTITDFVGGTDRIDLTALNSTSISIARLAGGGSVVFAETPGGGFQTFVAGANLNGGDLAFTGGFGVYVIGSEGNDTIVGTALPDPIVGNGGNDSITGGGGADALAGGAGRDVFRYVSQGDSNQTTGFDNLYDFTSGEDWIDMSRIGATSVSILRSDNGSSFLYAETPQGIFLTTAAGRAIQASDLLYGDGPIGGSFGVYMVGSGVADVLTGTFQADPIYGGAGDDIITGGGGADALFGDSGADTFVYRNQTDSTQAMTDGIFGFVSGTDKLDLRAVRTGAADTFGIAYLSGGSYLFVDLGGNGTSDLVIGLAGTTLIASDILWNTSAIGEEPGVKAAGPEVLPVGDEGELFDGEMSLDLSPMTARCMLDLEGARGFHGQDWYS